MRFTFSAITILICVLSVPALASPGPSSPYNGLMPHQALYDIRLKETVSGSQILNVSGQMFYEWKPSCEAWITNHRFNLLYEYADMPSMRVTSDFSTFEAFDGSSLDFVSIRRRDGEVFEEFRGRAIFPPNDNEAPGRVEYTMPAGLEYDLPAGTLFPMAHTQAALQAAKRGDRFLNAVIFDGSDAEGPVEVNAFIGDSVNAMAHLDSSAGLDPGLLNVPAWQGRLAFFPLEGGEGLADYEMSVILHNNSVVSDMIVEYDDFTVSQKLVALDRIEGGCGLPETQTKGSETGTKPEENQEQ